MVITEEYFCIIFEIVGPWIFFTWIYNVLLRLSFQRPLNQQRMNHGYSTMSDGILNGIFLIVHRNFLLSHFRGCWLLNFFCVCAFKVCWHMKRLSRRFEVDVFIKRLQQRGHEFWDETNLLAKEMLYNSARFLLVFIFIHDNDKKRPFTRPACSQRT